ncbi:MAG: hypothetical protein JWM62_2318, partial [Frankiales bacterium]|nr:hypothetical protein [Frankiales bacterium]
MSTWEALGGRRLLLALLPFLLVAIPTTQASPVLDPALRVPAQAPSPSPPAPAAAAAP